MEHQITTIQMAKTNSLRKLMMGDNREIVILVVGFYFIEVMVQCFKEISCFGWMLTENLIYYNYINLVYILALPFYFSVFLWCLTFS